MMPAYKALVLCAMVQLAVILGDGLLPFYSE